MDLASLIGVGCEINNSPVKSTVRDKGAHAVLVLEHSIERRAREAEIVQYPGNAQAG